MAPVSEIGWLPSEEILQWGAELYERVRSAHGEKAAAFLKVHATEDIDHLAKAYAALESIEEKALPNLIENLHVSAGLYLGILSQCGEKAKATKAAA